MRSHLSPLDAILLELEQEDEAAHMHLGWAMVFAPPPGGGRPSLERLREQVRQRLGGSSMLRRRLSTPRVDLFSLPVWLPDPDFDVGQLIHSATLPAPGGEAELTSWLGDYFSHRLDRTRPLWEVTLLEGLEGGDWALVGKVHHCLIDGISGVYLAAALLDVEQEPEEDAIDPGVVVHWIGREPKRGVLWRLRGTVGEAAGGGVDAAVRPATVRAILERSREMADALTGEDSAQAPPTSLNGSTGTSRRLATLEAPLEEVKRVKQELGGMVNDVILTAVAGGLRRLFEHRGEEVDDVRAMVPVSLEHASGSIAAGDGISSFYVELPLGEPDPLSRYRRIAAASRALRSEEAEGRATEADLSPPLVQTLFARLAFTPHLFNVAISTVPASPTTLYAQGAPMRSLIPQIPISSGQNLAVAAISYDGNIIFGLNADRDAVPDLDLVRTGIEETLDDLARVVV